MKFTLIEVGQLAQQANSESAFFSMYTLHTQKKEKKPIQPILLVPLYLVDFLNMGSSLTYSQDCTTQV